MTGSSKWSTRRSSARSWSSQWLLATQTAQMWLRSRNSISVIVRRYSVSCSDVVVTSMPSATAVVQAGASLVEPGDLDDTQPARARVGQPVEVAHRRDVDAVLGRHGEDRLAIGPGDVGAVDPERVDGHAGTACRLDRADPGRADPVDDVGEVLVAEVAQGAEDRVRGALAEAAQAGPLDHRGEPLHLGEVVDRSPGRVEIRSSSIHSWVVPTRQGTHLPQDSSRMKSMKYLATLTMHDVSSMTIIPPEPMNDPTSMSDS